MLHILIADDHDVVRSGLRLLLEAQPNWEIVGEASNGRAAVSKAIELRPDVAVIDYSLPMLNGLEVTRHILERAPRTEVLIFTMHDNEVLIQEAFKAGVRGYLLKSDARQHLIEAVQSLAVHKPFFSSKISEGMINCYSSKSGNVKSAITSRERTIVHLIAEGSSNKIIANTLNISLKTVETHRASVMRKLGLSSSADLVRFAVRNNIVEA
jgi:DNA-binding NarL/FixJ family response regulator